MDVYAPSPEHGPLQQGEILSNVVELRPVPETLGQGSEGVEYYEKEHPLAIVLTQACDLDWDHTARSKADGKRLDNKLLPNVLLCEVWLASQLRGNQALNGSVWRRAESNHDERYHCLPCPSADQDLQNTGFQEGFALDFKRVFTLGTEELYVRLSSETNRRCCLQGPFMQSLSNRFGYYQLRVALPELDQQPERVGLPSADTSATS